MTGERHGGVHATAARGFAVAPAVYERGRPDYPRAAVAHVERVLGLGPGAVVVDVAAGTGKLTRALRPSGARVVAVEPVEPMRATLARTTPGVEVVAGLAEALPLRSGSADAAVVAQAFHWFDAPAAVAELARVLRPGGGLALVWNRGDGEEPWAAQLRALLDAHAGATPRQRSDHWRRGFEEHGGFEPLERARFRNDLRVPLEAALDRVASVSYVAALPAAERAELLRAAADLMRPALEPDGHLSARFATDVFVTRRA